MTKTDEDCLVEFRRCLAEATKQINKEYFLVPVAGSDGECPIEKYRERVYAYELYHHLRSGWTEASKFLITGEVDKRSYLYFARDDPRRDSIPDLLVHKPGIQQNLVIIEIKPFSSASDRTKLLKDLTKLIAFRGAPTSYAEAIFLVYGEDIEPVRRMAGNLHCDKGIEIDKVKLWHHREPGCEAKEVPWNSV